MAADARFLVGVVGSFGGGRGAFSVVAFFRLRRVLAGGRVSNHRKKSVKFSLQISNRFYLNKFLTIVDVELFSNNRVAKRKLSYVET